MGGHVRVDRLDSFASDFAWAGRYQNIWPAKRLYVLTGRARIGLRSIHRFWVFGHGIGRGVSISLSEAEQPGARTLEGSAPFGQSRHMIQSKSLMGLHYFPS